MVVYIHIHVSFLLEVYVPSPRHNYTSASMPAPSTSCELPSSGPAVVSGFWSLPSVSKVPTTCTPDADPEGVCMCVCVYAYVSIYVCIHVYMHICVCVGVKCSFWFRVVLRQVEGRYKVGLGSCVLVLLCAGALVRRLKGAWYKRYNHRGY